MRCGWRAGLYRQSASLPGFSHSWLLAAVGGGGEGLKTAAGLLAQHQHAVIPRMSCPFIYVFTTRLG
jgi:hypothetical protein